MKQHILFDFDGTIFDTLEGISKSVRYALSLRGIDEPLEALRCFAGPPLVDMFMEHNGFTREQAEAAVVDFRSRYHKEGLEECCVFPGAAEAILRLKEAGRTIGIATSKPQNLAEYLLEREHMTGLFDIICGSRPGTINETKADILMRALEALNATAENAVLVGDTKWDAIGAAKAGVECIGVRWGYAEDGELESYGVRRIAQDPQELVRLLLDM